MYITSSKIILSMVGLLNKAVLTQPYATVLQQVAKVVKHGFLVLSADPAEVAKEATTTGYHFGKSNFL